MPTAQATRTLEQGKTATDLGIQLDSMVRIASATAFTKSLDPEHPYWVFHISSTGRISIAMEPVFGSRYVGEIPANSPAFRENLGKVTVDFPEGYVRN